MGLMQSLFGGETQKSKSTSTPVDLTPSAIKGLRTPFADTIKGLLGTGTGGGLSGIPSPTGDLVAPISSGEQNALATFSADDPLQGARRDLLTKTLQGNFLPGQPGANPFMQASIEAAQRPLLQGLTDTLTRTLPGRFTQAGQFTNRGGSSPFDFAAARATGDTANALKDVGTNIAFGTQEAERGRQQEAVQLGQNEVNTMLTNLQAQALPRLIQDQGIERGQQIFQQRLQALLQALGVVTQAPLQTIGTEQVNKSSGSSTGGIVPGVANLISAVKK